MNFIIYILIQYKMIIFLLKKVLNTKLMTYKQDIANKTKNDLIHNP